MNTDKIARYVWKGRHDARWYHQAEELFVDLFGRDRLHRVAGVVLPVELVARLEGAPEGEGGPRAPPARYPSVCGDLD